VPASAGRLTRTLGRTTNPIASCIGVDKLFFLLVLSAAVLAAFAVGGAYFLKAYPGSSLSLRLATSAYGPAIGIIFLFVATLWPESHQYNAKGTRLLLQLQGIPLLLTLASLALYPGPRKLHVLLVPIGFVLWASTFGMSWVGVHGK
jgi:ABC-type Na+ efflux pump permease subunit